MMSPRQVDTAHGCARAYVSDWALDKIQAFIAKAAKGNGLQVRSCARDWVLDKTEALARVSPVRVSRYSSRTAWRDTRERAGGRELEQTRDTGRSALCPREGVRCLELTMELLALLVR